MHLTRRHALGALGALTLAGLAPDVARADGFAGVIGAAIDAAGGFRVGAIDGALGEAEGAPAPVRLHALCPRPDGREAVAVARRPGDLALVLDGRATRVRAVFRATEGRRFSGHGVYRDGGRLFLTTEIDAGTGEGVIVVRDVAGGYAAASEFRSSGVGPHELVAAGRLIAVANGAKEPKSDPGVAALETTRTRSNLVMLDPAGGAVDRTAELDDDLASLSLRHLATTPDGGVLVAAQDTEAGVRDRPLVARLDGARLKWLDEDLAVTSRFAGYVGSLAVDRSGRFAAASSPKGGVVAAFDLADDAALGVVAIADVCGLAVDAEAGRFIATTGLGEVLRLAVHEGGVAVIERRSGPLRWDNHLASLPPA
jgi:hypothetical protein